MTAAILGMDFELQKAIAAALAADTNIKSLIGDPARIFQTVPSPNTVTFPYITIGESQMVPDLAECIDGREVFPVLHIWSHDSSFQEAKKISANIWVVLQNGLTLTENKCLVFEPDGLGDISMRDPDGVTKHIASHYRAVCEPR